MNKNKLLILQFSILIISLSVFDLVTKYAATIYLTQHGTWSAIAGDIYSNILLFYTDSFAFGLALVQHHAENLFKPIVAFVIIFLGFGGAAIYGLISRWVAVFIIAGALGNVAEILYHGFVTDFIAVDLGYFRFFICMNFSDLFIHISTLVFIFQMFSGVFYAKKFSRLQGKKLTTMETLAFMRNRRAGKIQAS